MEIDSRFPPVQINQTSSDRAGGASTATGSPADSDSKFFISPVLKFDSRSLTVIFQVRDSLSGDVVRQFPSEAVVARYRKDPTTKPFVLPSTVGGEAPVEIKLASGSGASATRDATSDDGQPQQPSDASNTQSAPVDTVDLVA